MEMLRTKIGVVTSIDRDFGDVLWMKVIIDGLEYDAVSYASLAGAIKIGDKLLLNTTAVELGLGTGGVHFVICNLSDPTMETPLCPGHIMKMRYTPLQFAILAAEEDDSPYRAAISDFATLDEMPVVCCELHSQIAPIAAGIKSLIPKASIAYIMTDGASLPIGFSKLVRQLKESELIDTTITCGQAFGGDIEAINVYSALIAAKEALKCDTAIVSQGPGNVGANTRYGFSGIQQGESLNAVGLLGGTPVMTLRVSFADKRARHTGVSHHSLTIIEKIIHTKTIICMPVLDPKKSEIIMGQIYPLIQESGHELVTKDGQPGIDELERRGVHVTTMGRMIDEDKEFFLSASASGIATAAMIRDER